MDLNLSCVKEDTETPSSLGALSTLQWYFPQMTTSSPTVWTVFLEFPGDHANLQKEDSVYWTSIKYQPLIQTLFLHSPAWTCLMWTLISQVHRRANRLRQFTRSSQSHTNREWNNLYFYSCPPVSQGPQPLDDLKTLEKWKFSFCKGQEPSVYKKLKTSTLTDHSHFSNSTVNAQMGSQ